MPYYLTADHLGRCWLAGLCGHDYRCARLSEPPSLLPRFPSMADDTGKKTPPATGSAADASDDEGDLVSLTIKGPSGLQLPIQIGLTAPVRKLKQAVEKAKPDFPATSIRLIFGGKVLKDDVLLEDYKVQGGHTVHMVRSGGGAQAGTNSAPSTSATAARSAPAAAAATTAAASPAPTSGVSPAASAAERAEARGVPSTFGAGQTFTNNPLAALNRPDLAGPHMAALNPFAGMDGNPADPNFMMNLMEDANFQAQAREALAQPGIVDQILGMHPEMRPYRAMLENMLQSEHFREMLTNPEMMRRSQQMAAAMGAGGAGGLPGMGPFGGGLFGAPPATGAGGAPGAAQWPTFAPPANPAAGNTGSAGSTPANAASGEGGAGAAPGAPGAPGTGSGPADPLGQALLRALGGGGGTGEGAGLGLPPPNLFGGLGGLGGIGGLGGLGGLGGAPGGPGAASSGDSRPPEERFANELAQLQGMGFTNGPANLRALLLSGGSVEAAVTLLIEGGGI